VLGDAATPLDAAGLAEDRGYEIVLRFNRVV
jgi:hypothetical protein